MSDTPQGPGWWLASDGRYYPPQPPAPPSAPPTAPPTAAAPPEPGQPWAPPPQGTPPQGTPPQGTPVPPPRSGGGSTVALVVIGVVVLMAVVGVIGAAVLIFARAGSSDEDAAPATTTTITDDASGEFGATTVPSAGDGEVVATEFGFSTGEGFDGELAANAGAVIENSGSSSAAFFEVVFTFTDDDGATVGTETAYVYAIEPGGTAHAAVDAVSLQGPATAVDATVVIGDGSGFWTGTVVPVEVGEVVVDEFFGLGVDGTATNPTAAPIQSASVQCVVREGGRIVGGASAVLDTIVPGGEVTWEAITFSDWLRGDSAECSGGTYG